jgi:hypothetical protein
MISLWEETRLEERLKTHITTADSSELDSDQHIIRALMLWDRAVLECQALDFFEDEGGILFELR